MVFSSFTIDQIILWSDWIRDTVGHNQAKSENLLTFLDDYLNATKNKITWSCLQILMILSAENDDQRTLQTDWMKSKTGHTQPKEFYLHPKNLKN